MFSFIKQKSLVLAVVALLTLLLRQSPALALEPDEILLITNKNAPEGQKLADLYSTLRGIPAENQIALDLPASEEMSFNTYETGVVAPLREFLVRKHLNKKIHCLLTFYGVPFRIGAHTLTPAEQKESDDLKSLARTLGQQTADLATDLEGQAKIVDPTFAPRQGTAVPELLARAQNAVNDMGAQLPSIPDSDQKEALGKILYAALERIGGVADLDLRLQNEPASKLSADQLQHRDELHRRVLQARAEIAGLQQFRWDPVARAKLLDVARENFGIIGQMRVVVAEASYFSTEGTVACTDNELALLWWDYYRRSKFLGNPLKYNAVGNSPTTVMTMRLDGPDPATVEKLIRTSVAVEATGLQGIIAIDARGIQPLDDKGNPNAFGEFDEHLRHLEAIIRSRSTIKSRIDDEDIVFPPHFVKNVALYVGWYSVQHYIPGCDFNPGAVGYHVASYEMLTLHTPSSEWVRGLLTDGVVGTLGPVAEPYLVAFPLPDEFFPLLLTGKLTLAEVYWKTTPCTSWMIGFIGDPLYTPYRVHPMLKPEDLPGELSRALPRNPATQPSAVNSSAKAN